jgi:hypothetical protein
MPQPEFSQVDRIIDIASGSAPAGPSERENREATRVPFVGHVALLQRSSSGEKHRPILLVSDNLSSGGLCVIAGHELPVGGRGAILLLKSDGEPVILGARVVYVNALGPKGFECGLEFAPPPSDVSIDDFCDAAGDLPQVGPARAA